MKRKELAGLVFGRYTVISWITRSKNGTSKWLCRCECGTEKVIFATALLDGTTKSCGCLSREQAGKRLTTHGQTRGKQRSGAYISWDRMKQRCNTKSNKHYGGKGVSYCKKWESFENFLLDMGERPDGMTLDRIDPRGNYEPANCRWATHEQQAGNKTNNRVVEYEGKTYNLTELCRMLGVPTALVFKRIYSGWDLHAALIKPSQKGKKYVQESN